MASIDDVYNLLVKIQPQLQSVFDSIDRRNSSALETLMADCVAHYKMDDNADSTTVIDAIGTSNGTAARNTSLMHTVGIIGGAITFNGSDDYVDTNNAFNTVLNSNFTTIIWFNATDLPEDAVHGGLFGNNGNDRKFYLKINTDGKLTVLYQVSSEEGYNLFTTNDAVTNGADGWNQLACIVESIDVSTTRITIYLNGVSIGTKTSSSTTMANWNSTENHFIGMVGSDGEVAGGWPFNGIIDNVMIFNKALSADEIALLYNTDNGFALTGEADAAVTSLKGTDGKAVISTDTQDLSATLSVNAKKLNGATPNNLAAGAEMNLTSTYNAAKTAAQTGEAADAVEGLATEANATANKNAIIAAFPSECSGSGNVSFTYYVYNTSTELPLADVAVWITTDEAGENIVASARTDDFGNATFYLDAGTYYFWRKKAGVDFVNPDSETITG